MELEVKSDLGGGVTVANVLAIVELTFPPTDPVELGSFE